MSSRTKNKKKRRLVKNNNKSEKIKVEYFAPSKIVVGHSNIAGIGVFALEDINVGDLIERCPMVRMEHRSNYVHDPTIRRYMYTQSGCQCAECKKHGYHFWMVLGYGMLYNHQDVPNTSWTFKYADQYADVICTRPIKKGQEITVSYGSGYFRNREQTLSSETLSNIESELESMDNEKDFLKTVENYMNTISKNSNNPS